MPPSPRGGYIKAAVVSPKASMHPWKKWWHSSTVSSSDGDGIWSVDQESGWNCREMGRSDLVLDSVLAAEEREVHGSVKMILS